MSELDFEAVFERIKTAEAARDPELIRFYRERIHGNLPALPEAHDRIADEVCHVYDLDSRQFLVALGTCIASIIDGAGTGREIFNNG